MENFNTLTAVLAGSSVALTFKIPTPRAVSYEVQRTNFSEDGPWLLVATAAVTAPYFDTVFTATDTGPAPETGQYTYRVVVTDDTGTLFYSNTVNISNTATTGAVTLSGAVDTSVVDPTGPAGYSYVTLNWTVDDDGENDEVLKAEVQRSIDSGAHWRHAGNVQGNDTFTEMLPTGTGEVQYRVLVSLPSELDQLNTPKISTSNVVTISV